MLCSAQGILWLLEGCPAATFLPLQAGAVLMHLVQSIHTERLGLTESLASLLSHGLLGGLGRRVGASWGGLGASASACATRVAQHAGLGDWGVVRGCCPWLQKALGGRKGVGVAAGAAAWPRAASLRRGGCTQQRATLEERSSLGGWRKSTDCVHN